MTASRGISERFADVGSLLTPKSVVVVGASDREGNLGGSAVRYLRKFGFPGDVLPVNPGRESVAGLRCYPSLANLPPLTPPTLAVLAVPASGIVDLIHQCARAGIGYGVIWAGGFAELDADGATLQAELVRACRETGFLLVGPNSLGVIDTHLPLTATFSSYLLTRDRLDPGDISMVSQSGGLATMVQALADELGFGFRYMIASGNEAVVTTPDYLHALAHDDETRVISLYVEGIRDGDKFAYALDEAHDAGKPVVVLKAGLSKATARAAAAHTGALVGEDRVWRSILRQHGAIQVETLEELLDVVVFLSSTDITKLPKGRGVATVTFGGGMGVLSADGCARSGLDTPTFSDSTLEQLSQLVPPIASIANPVDLTPAAYYEPWISRLPAALQAMADDPAVDVVLAQFGTTPLDGLRMADAVSGLRHLTEKTVAIAWPFAPPGVSEHLRDQGMFMFREYARATNAIGKIAAVTSESDPTCGVDIAPADFDWIAAVPNATPGAVISEADCHRLLAAGGLSTARGEPAFTRREAVTAADTIGFPVVMKGISGSVIHRAAAGLVLLDVRTGEEAGLAFDRIRECAAEQEVKLDSVYVQRMMPDGVDLLVSAMRDPVFGVMMSLGWGGGLTEEINDVVLRRAPFGEEVAMRLLQSLRISRRLFQDGAPDDLARFAARFSQLAAAIPWRSFVLEVNPVRWDGSTAAAVDGLLVIEEL